MQLKLVPIPHADLEATEHAWLSFIERLQDRTGEHLLDKIRTGETLLFCAWDDDAKTAVALAGARIILRRTARVAEILWICGDNMRAWIDLLPALETHLREHQGCIHVRAVMREGLVPIMRHYGYRRWHVVMQKDL